MSEDNLIFDDHLFVINFSENSELLQTLFSLLKDKMQTNESTYNIKELEDDEEVNYFEFSNKYFKSSVQIIFADQEIFDQSNETNLTLNNYMFLIDSLEHWEKFKSNKEVINLIKTSDKFKMIVLEDTLVTKIDVNAFYDSIESYIAIFSLSIHGSQVDKSDNESIAGEILEMMTNNIWNHQKNEQEKPSVKDEPAKKNEEFDIDENKEEKFVNIFDQIMSFKEKTRDMSPSTRKNKACDLMTKLMENFGDDSFDDDDNKKEDDDDYKEYQKI